MPSIHFGLLAAPDKHEQIIKDINKWKYDIEGEVAKGKQSPVIHELKFYEVRVPPELEADFVRDMGLKMTLGTLGTARHSWAMRLLYGLYRAVLFFSPYKPVDESKITEPKKYSFTGTWHYPIPLGKLRRAPVKVKCGKDREVL